MLFLKEFKKNDFEKLADNKMFEKLPSMQSWITNWKVNLA